jgi:hypothetical protein
VQQELTAILVCLAQETTKLPQILPLLAGTAPSIFVRGLPLEQIEHLMTQQVTYSTDKRAVFRTSSGGLMEWYKEEAALVASPATGTNSPE